MTVHEDDVGEVAPTQVGLGEVDALKSLALEAVAAQGSQAEVGALDLQTVQPCTGQIHAPQPGTGEIGSEEVRLEQVRA